MKIESVEVVAVSLPLVGTFKTSHNVRDSLKSVVVRVRDSEGQVGYGSVDPAPGYMDETVEEVTRTIEARLADVLVGRLPVDRGPIWCALRDAAPESYCARAALDLAVWDLYGRQAHLSLSAMLGGSFRTEIPLIGWIGLVSAEEAAEKACALVAQGHSGIKVKVGAGGAEDIERLRAVRLAIGPRIHVRVDANEHFTVEDAAAFLDAAEKCGLNLCEQPLPRGHWKDLAWLRRRTKVPIMVDEGIYTCADVLALYEARAADAIKFKVMKHGGIYGTAEVMGLAVKLGFQCTVGHGFSLSPVAMAEAALAGTLRSPLLPAEMVGPLKLKADVVKEPFPIRSGSLALSSDVGLGVSVSESALQKYSVSCT